MHSRPVCRQATLCDFRSNVAIIVEGGIASRDHQFATALSPMNQDMCAISEIDAVPTCHTAA